ncbi:MAG: Ig-like domain-containing protein [Bacteroidales bacterium]|nr:Ig-like domain-containing protein [Bacteroidales bacterium]
MKNNVLVISLGFLLLLGGMAGCDEYENKEAGRNISVNQPSLNMFVGDTVQLVASPSSGGAFTWQSEDGEVATVSGDGTVIAKGAGATDIVVAQGEVRIKVPVSAKVKVPLNDITIACDVYPAIFAPGNTSLVVLTLDPPDADAPVPVWTSTDPQVALVNATGELTFFAGGTSDITCRVGSVEKTIQVTVLDSQDYPWFNGPHILSKAGTCTVKAADFDLGGEGVAYHDSDADDSSGQDRCYRKAGGDSNSPGMDVEGCAGRNIGWTGAGEWMRYTVYVYHAGQYQVDIEAATPTLNGNVDLIVDNSATHHVPFSGFGSQTNEWGVFAWYNNVATLTLTEGKHEIIYYIHAADHNVGGLRFTWTGE